MSSATELGTAPAAGQRPLPKVFDRLVVILSGQAHLFALLIIVQSWSVYRSTTGQVLLWLFSLSIPLGSLALAQRSGGVLSRTGLVTVGLAILVVDIGGGLTVRPADLGSPAIWTWGVVGVTLLTLAPFRPMREILLLGALHGVVLLVIMTWARSAGGADAFRILADLSAGVIPVLAAAQFVRLYIGALRARQDAAGQLLAAEAGVLVAETVGVDTTRRLDWLRAETVPLLEGVVAASLSPSDGSTATLAQRLSRDLRRELLEARAGLWLLGIGAAGQRATEVLDPQRCLERLDEADRAALAVLVKILREAYTWDRFSVALTAAHDVAGPGVVVTVVATGPMAGVAAQDGMVLAAGSQLRATVTCEGPELLVADAEVGLR